MKKTILTITMAGLLLVGTTISCNTPSEKIEDAKENIKESEKDLELANKEYLEEMHNYRAEAAAKIEENRKSIDELN